VLDAAGDFFSLAVGAGAGVGAGAWGNTILLSSAFWHATRRGAASNERHFKAALRVYRCIIGPPAEGVKEKTYVSAYGADIPACHCTAWDEALIHMATSSPDPSP
jgi:hypothetical protein